VVGGIVLYSWEKICWFLGTLRIRNEAIIICKGNQYFSSTIFKPVKNEGVMKNKLMLLVIVFALLVPNSTSMGSSTASSVFTTYFDPIIAADLDANPDTMQVGDFNGDGRSDVLFHWKSTGRNFLYFSNGNGTFTTYLNPIPVGQIDEYPDNLRVGDTNGDGRSDIYFHWKATGSNLLYFSNGNGTFTRYVDPVSRADADANPDNVQFGDFNGDGRSDLIFHWKSLGRNYLYFSNGDGSFVRYENPISTADLDANPDNMRIGDFNGDGRSDLYFHWKSWGRNYLYFSNGDGTFTTYLNPIDPADVDANPNNMLLGDFNGDGRCDVFFHWSSMGRNIPYFSNGDGTFQKYFNPIGIFAVDEFPDNLGVGDFNGDGRSDLYYHWKITGNNRLFFSKGDGTFIGYMNPVLPADVDAKPDNMRIADFSGDGRSDVYFHWKAWGRNRLYSSNFVVYPTGSLTTPTEGAKIGPGTVALSAVANPGTDGNSVQSVTFKVLYDGEWHEIGTDTTAPYQINWTTPKDPSLRTQQIYFAINITDSAGTVIADVGGRRTVNFIETLTPKPTIIEKYISSSKRVYLNQRSLGPNGDDECGAASATMVLAMNGRIKPDYATMKSVANAIFPKTISRKLIWPYLIVNEMRARGLNARYRDESANSGWNVIKSEINAGHPVILLSRKVSDGHFFVVVGYREEGSSRKIIVQDPFGKWNGKRYDRNSTFSDSTKGRWVSYDYNASWGGGLMITARPYSLAMDAAIVLEDDDIPDPVSEELLEEADYLGELIGEGQPIFLPMLVH
jgi:cold shock CspA family protein